MKTRKHFLVGQDSAGASIGCKAGAGQSQLGVSGLSDATAGATPPGVTTEHPPLPLRVEERHGPPAVPLPTGSPKQRGPATLGLAPPSSFTQAPAEGPPNSGVTGERMPVGLRGGVGTTEGHGEEGEGCVGRRAAVLAADPSLPASKAEPILGGASPRVLGGLRRHSAWSAEKHLC
uniref:Uncharacterized protein n=1 Tax=Rangifer tarandus platyrhynchus TaxID=3082113 RepID=A0ACB0F232_RANTA|nr:unnamed protein product [Rangifer tarandus platyrhynchus]